ncbi:cadherin domain protein [marine gamma proteobacterium HTCC2207]|nr:cadherin domain protein [marine gamma proteobacterium HTCC2207] [gamma proteobacterium HTCC2207]
ASAVSRIKAKAVAEITSAAEVVVAAVSVQQAANETVVLAVEDVDVSSFITLDNEDALNATIALNIQEVEAYLVTTIAPVIESGGNFVAAENQTAVGTVVASDTVGDVLTYSLSGADASALNISNTGVLSFVSAPDFETKAQYNATVTVVDSNGNSVSQAISISITDANDSAPIITSSSSFSADENQLAIGAVVASSPSNAALAYSLSGNDAEALSISTDGVLSFVTAPNFEVKASYSATVVVSDGTNDTSTAINVSIVNLNDSAPVITSVNEFSLKENTKSVGTITATDADLDILTYVLSGADASAFTLSSVGSLQFKAAPNFEVKANYSVSITVSDGVNSDSAELVITVTNVDDVAPVFTSEASFSAAENQTSIDTVTATDVDSDLVTFSVDSTELAISSGGVLSFIAAADFEAKSAYSVTVTATDGTNTATQIIAITVTDADEDAPVISSSPAFSAAENQTAIGSVVATDAGSLTFGISGTELAISSEGVLSFVSAPDYETKATYTATVTVTDSGALATSQAITVAVTDVDDVAPVFTSEASFSAAENQTSIGTVTATDVDSDLVTFSVDSAELAISSGGVLSFINAADFETKSAYSVTVTATDGTNTATQIIAITVTDADEDAPVISSSPAFSAAENQTAIGSVLATDAGSLSFSISGTELAISSEGVLSFVSTPDYETKATYTATVTVTDAGSLATSQNITVAVTDIDDVAPVFTSEASFSAAENQTSIGTVTATDVDSDLVTFSVDSTELAISSGGVLSFIAAADFEAKSAYSVTVTATDGTNTATQIIAITVTDADEDAPVISSSPAFSAAENQTAIGSVLATDAGSLSFSISGTELAISSEGVLSFVSTPDYETKATYTATVTVTDAGSLATSQNITVAVTDIDDVAPVFTSEASFSAAENQTSIGTVTATDVDSDLVTFSVDSAELAISSGGVLSFIAAADFEAKSAYSVTVTATDGTNTATQIIAITVTDADEDAPVISSSPAFSAAENQTAIGSVLATDAGSLSFSISGTELAISSEGVLSFVSAPDYETKATYTATVTVTDAGSLATSQNITVAVTDIDDVAPVFTSEASFSAAENQTSIGTVTANDVDSDLVTFSVDSTELAISSGGVLSFIAAADSEAKSAYSVTVTATDGTNTATRRLTVL